MRRHKVAAAHLMVFIHTSPFAEGPEYSNSVSGRFMEATNDTAEIVGLALRLGARLWRDGYRYAKAGVVLTELLPETMHQPSLWGELDREKRAKLWRVVDSLNADLGRDSGAPSECGARSSFLEAEGIAPLATAGPLDGTSRQGLARNNRSNDACPNRGATPYGWKGQREHPCGGGGLARRSSPVTENSFFPSITEVFIVNELSPHTVQKTVPVGSSGP